MKKLFYSAIPICLVSFILFGISAGILGTKPYHSTTDYAVSSGTVYETADGACWIDQIVEDVEEWTLDARSEITLHTSGVNAYVVQSEDDLIHLRVASSGKRISVQASGDDATLTLKISPPISSSTAGRISARYSGTTTSSISIPMSRRSLPSRSSSTIVWRLCTARER